jgi:hypothetical protein
VGKRIDATGNSRPSTIIHHTPNKLVVKVKGTLMCLELIYESCQCHRAIFGIALLSLLVNLLDQKQWHGSKPLGNDKHAVGTFVFFEL